MLPCEVIPFKAIAVESHSFQSYRGAKSIYRVESRSFQSYRGAKSFNSKLPRDKVIPFKALLV